MIIKSAAENLPVLSNVGETGEFRIRNSAKAFSILSSGLYANKIKAIIREYSCNAWDSHIMAGRADCPFDVHLPNTLEPWFAVRDYGIGLSHDGVVQIYTTYFESTKSESNDVIGGLGLGSKAAFSYTDNFTVTAVKDGRRGVYTAFINEQGVPSIALMMEEETTDPNGVEVRFGVNDSYDFRKFHQEAREVFKYFATKPNVIGVEGFEPETVNYARKDIMPGVHELGRSHYSTAVMGNIGYPLQVPNAVANLGDLAQVLECGLELHFDIGELDIQASREGLSYIPETIAAIKAKLQAVADHLESYIAEELKQYTNEWDHALQLEKFGASKLTQAAATQYLHNNPNDLISNGYYGRPHVNRLRINAADLVKWNISFSAFRSASYSDVVKTIRVDTEYDHVSKGSVSFWQIPVASHFNLVINDGQSNPLIRAKRHFKALNGEHIVWLAQPIDKKVPMNTAALIKALHNPPKQMMVSALTPLEKAVRGPAAAPVLSNAFVLQKRNAGSYAYRSRDADLVWREDKPIASFDKTATHYYVPIKALTAELEGQIDVGALVSKAVSSGLFPEGTKVYGLRKDARDAIANMPNWVNFETVVVDTINGIDAATISKMAASMVDGGDRYRYTDDVLKLVAADSPYKTSIEAIRAADKIKFDHHSLRSLITAYGDKITQKDVTNKVDIETAALRSSVNRYPLLSQINHYADAAAVAEYIELIDAAKGK